MMNVDSYTLDFLYDIWLGDSDYCPDNDCWYDWYDDDPHGPDDWDIYWKLVNIYNADYVNDLIFCEMADGFNM